MQALDQDAAMYMGQSTIKSAFLFTSFLVLHSILNAHICLDWSSMYLALPA